MAERTDHMVLCPARGNAVLNLQTMRYEAPPCTCGFDDYLEEQRMGDFLRRNKKEPKKLLAPGKWRKIPDGEENWCHDCQKPSLMVANVGSLTDSGVDHWGTVTACVDCLAHEYRNAAGEKVAVEIKKNPGSEPY